MRLLVLCNKEECISSFEHNMALGLLLALSLLRIGYSAYCLS